MSSLGLVSSLCSPCDVRHYEVALGRVTPSLHPILAVTRAMFSVRMSFAFAMTDV